MVLQALRTGTEESEDGREGSVKSLGVKFAVGMGEKLYWDVLET